MHSRGNKSRSWPNFWANLASFSLSRWFHRQDSVIFRPTQPLRNTVDSDSLVDGFMDKTYSDRPPSDLPQRCADATRQVAGQPNLLRRLGITGSARRVRRGDGNATRILVKCTNRSICSGRRRERASELPCAQRLWSDTTPNTGRWVTKCRGCRDNAPPAFDSFATAISGPQVVDSGSASVPPSAKKRLLVLSQFFQAALSSSADESGR